MFIHNINPILLNFGSLQIRYYGIIFALGFIISYYMIKHLAKKRNMYFDIDSLFVYLFFGVLIGARFFEVFIYNFPLYQNNLVSIFYIWNGGLSFHGGLIGAIISSYLFTKKNKIDFYELADMAVIPVALALFLGRIANFINGELVGKITEVPWAVKFPGFEGFRHPTQIYESLKNLFIFFTLFNLKDLKLQKGYLFWTFITLYSLFRFVIEFIKETSLNGDTIIYGLNIAQWLTLPMFSIGVYFLSKYTVVPKMENEVHK